MDATQCVRDGGKYKLTYYLRMPDDKLQGDKCSHAVAKDIGLSQPKLLDCSGNVICHSLEREGPIYILSVAVCLQFECNNQSISGKARQQPSKRGADRRKSAMNENQWLIAFTMNLVVHLEPIN